jgi:hypothetical protein
MRDGLKHDEVYTILRHYKAEIEEGKEPEVAFALACRAVPGVTPATYKAWKPEILALHEGKSTAIAAPKEVLKGFPGTAAQRIGQLTQKNANLEVENNELKDAVARLSKEVAELKKK